MSSNFRRDENESIPWTPVLRSLGFQNIELSKDKEDWTEGFDMVARRYAQGPLARFSLRRRTKPKSLDWLKQFTIRWKLFSGARTEKDKILDKILDGSAFPDYFCYGFTLADGFKPWVILRIANLRRMHEDGELQAAKVDEHWNLDKDPSFFHAFSLPKLVRCDPDLVWKSSPNHPGIPAIQTPTPSRHPPLHRQLKF